MSGEARPLDGRSEKPTRPVRSLKERLEDHKRLLLRAGVIIEDAGLGSESLLVAPNADGTINQTKLAQVLAGAGDIIEEVTKFLEALIKEQDAGQRRAAS